MWTDTFAPLIARTVSAVRTAPNRQDAAPARRILVFRVGELGDTVIALPAFWALRRHFPEAQLCLLSNNVKGMGRGMAHSVLPEEGLFDSYLHYPSSARGTDWRGTMRLHRQIRQGRFDLVVHLTPSLRTEQQVQRDALFFQSAGISRQLLPDSRPDSKMECERLRLVDSQAAVVHEADQLLSRLERHGVRQPMPPAMDLRLSADERRAAREWLRGQKIPTNRMRVAFGPGASKASKKWPEERYRRLGQLLIDQWGIHPVIFGGPDEREMGDRLIQAWGRGSNAAGALSVRNAAAALETCQLYVGNDTGTTHLAAASGVRCVVPMSAQDAPGKWDPYGPGHQVLRRNVSCAGCRLAECVQEGLRCLTEISVDEAYAACAPMLAALQPGGVRRHAPAPVFPVLAAMKCSA